MPKSFDEVWRDLVSYAETNRTISTLDHSKANEILDIGKDKIIVRPRGTQKEQVLLKDDFRHVWNILTKNGSLELKETKPELMYKKSIIFAFLASLSYINSAKTKPLKIFLREPKAAEQIDF